MISFKRKINKIYIIERISLQYNFKFQKKLHGVFNKSTLVCYVVMLLLIACDALNLTWQSIVQLQTWHLITQTCDIRSTAGRAPPYRICHSVKSYEISVEEGYFRAHWIDSHDSMTTERANSIVTLFTILVPYSLSCWTYSYISAQ